MTSDATQFIRFFMETAYKTTRLPFSSQQLYAEYVEQVQALRAMAAQFPPVGVPVRKVISGHAYIYAQYSELGERRQVSLGREDSEETQGILSGWSSLNADRDRLAKMSRMLAHAGVHVPDAGSSRVLKILADQGVFTVGAVLIGSHAFAAYELPLGIIWSSGWRTADIDIAADSSMNIATPPLARLEEILERTELPFRGIPALNHQHPSTSFSFHGRELRVDLLTPLVGKPASGPIKVGALGAWAHPLRFLDFLIEETVEVAIPAAEGILVNVPTPARFAIHKLIVATRRPSIDRAKKTKDISQAGQLIEWLLEEQPEELEDALNTACARGKKWEAAIQRSMLKLPESLQEELGAMWGA